MSTPRRHRLATAVQISLLLTLPALAAAQDPAPAPATPGTAEEARTLDTVVVTGTRIRRAEVEGQVPVQVLTREDIDRSGFTSVAEVVQNLTASGAALNTKFNSSGNFGFPPDGGGVGAGAATVDLRHLGPKRVLVLVDGIRWVNESSASGVGSSVDLNTIPLSIIERIEGLEDGASSIYGSDAIAGVVNIITRRNVEGAQVDLHYGDYDKDGGETWGADLSWGGSTDRARTSRWRLTASTPSWCRCRSRAATTSRSAARGATGSCWITASTPSSGPSARCASTARRTAGWCWCASTPSTWRSAWRSSSHTVAARRTITASFLSPAPSCR